MNQPLTDNSIMPFGIHKGKAMVEVPDTYLKSLYESGKCFGPVKDYIEDNAQSLKIKIVK